ncbi:MAG: fatty acid desaturase family protein [Myxococcota bacterium]
MDPDTDPGRGVTLVTQHGAAVRPSLAFEPNAIRQRFPSAFEPRRALYWADLLGSTAVGWSAFWLALGATTAAEQWGLAALSVLALLRAAMFVHEVAHLKRGAVPGFELAWNALVGLPLLLPSLVYAGSHSDHHRRAAFGTEYDPEYAPIAHWSHLRLVRFVLGVALMPVFLPLRWGLLGPASYLLPRFRRAVVERSSTLVINADYRRPAPEKRRDVWRWRLQEGACAGVVWLAFAAWLEGLLPTAALVQWYGVAAGILALNQVRTLAAHGYENEGEQVDALDQVLDSFNLDGVPLLTALVAPVGLRYHALHHFLPTVPYHSLGALHRALCRELPRDAEYRATRRTGVAVALVDLWRRSQADEDWAGAGASGDPSSAGA